MYSACSLAPENPWCSMQTKTQVTWLFIYCPCQAIAYTSGWRGSPATGGVSYVACNCVVLCMHASEKCGAALRRTGSIGHLDLGDAWLWLSCGMTPMLPPEALRACPGHNLGKARWLRWRAAVPTGWNWSLRLELAHHEEDSATAWLLAFRPSPALSSRQTQVHRFVHHARPTRAAAAPGGVSAGGPRSSAAALRCAEQSRAAGPERARSQARRPPGGAAALRFCAARRRAAHACLALAPRATRGALLRLRKLL